MDFKFLDGSVFKTESEPNFCFPHIPNLYSSLHRHIEARPIIESFTPVHGELNGMSQKAFPVCCESFMTIATCISVLPVLLPW